MVGMFHWVIIRSALRGTKDILSGELQCPHVENSICLIPNSAVPWLRLWVEDVPPISDIDHFEGIPVGQRAVPPVTNAGIAVKGQFIHYCIDDKRTADPSQTRIWKKPRGGISRWRFLPVGG